MFCTCTNNSRPFFVKIASTVAVVLLRNPIIYSYYVCTWYKCDSYINITISNFCYYFSNSSTISTSPLNSTLSIVFQTNRFPLSTFHCFFFFNIFNFIIFFYLGLFLPFLYFFKPFLLPLNLIFFLQKFPLIVFHLYHLL